MKKLFFLLISVFTLVVASAEVKVDADSYCEALARFTSQTEVSAADAATVYYGSSLQPDFNHKADYVNVINLYSQGDMAAAYDAAVAALATDPANLQLLFKAYACAAVMGKPEAEALRNRATAVCDAIFASGRGVIQERPFLYTHTADINEFLIKYIGAEKILASSGLGNLYAVKVSLAELPDDVIFYFLPYSEK